MIFPDTDNGDDKVTIHRLCDQDTVIGLTWLAPVVWPPTGRERRKVRELQSLEKEIVGYVEMETPVGCQLGATTNKEHLGLTSGAVQLAQMQRSVVLIEPLSDDLFWLCTIEDGAVFPAGDLVGNKDLIAERLTEIQTDISGKQIPFYDKSGTFDIQGVQQLDFAELVEGSIPKPEIVCQPLQTRQLKAATLSMVAVVVLFCLTAGGWQILRYINTIDHEALTSQQVSEQIFEREKSALQQTIGQHVPALLATFADAIFDRPLRAGGWKTQIYEWQDDVISVTWYREHGSAHDISTHLETKQFEFNSRTDVLTETIPFTAPVRQTDDVIEKLLGTDTERMRLLDQLARLPGHWTLKSAERYAQQLPVTRSKLRGDGDRLNQLIASAVSLQNLPLHVSRIKVTLADLFDWEVEADYYAYAE